MRIVLADPYAMMRDGLRALLTTAGHDVVADTGAGDEAVQLVREHAPHIVILDTAMPALNGIDAARQLRTQSPEARVIALSHRVDGRHVFAMFDAGAAAYVVKSAPARELFEAIDAAMSGRKYVSAPVAEALVDAVMGATSVASKADTLTPRERQVLQLVAEGSSTKEIALRLSVSLATVETHRRQIGTKLGIQGVAQLTRFAIAEGISSLGE